MDFHTVWKFYLDINEIYDSKKRFWTLLNHFNHDNWKPQSNLCQTARNVWYFRQKCYHGNCVAPDVCQCEGGFGGKDCSKCKNLSVFYDFYFMFFFSFSIWHSELYCLRRDLFMCFFGRDWHFISYSTYLKFSFFSACPAGRWGPSCSHRCPCYNGASCDPVSGECTCSPGWQGERCDSQCSDQRYGQNCREICKCQNGKNC